MYAYHYIWVSILEIAADLGKFCEIYTAVVLVSNIIRGEKPCRSDQAPAWLKRVEKIFG
jgi:hypothetical protein